MDRMTTVYDLLIWSIRAAVIALVTLKLFRYATKSDERPSIISPNGILNHKAAHNVGPGDRPLQRIQEELPLCPAKMSSVYRNRSVYSRDAILAARLLMQSAVRNPKTQLFHVITEFPVPHQKVVGVSEKESLQSLLQFRLKRGSGLQGATWNEWNIEARRIVSGAALTMCKGACTDVLSVLDTNGVLPDSDTFTLLVDASLKIDGYETARSIVIRMVDAGYRIPVHFGELMRESVRSSRAVETSLNRNAKIFVPRHAVAM
jgi:hypothetical protein